MTHRPYHDTFRIHHSPGDTVSIRFGGVLRHYGVVTSRGTVICNSRKHGGVVEQSLAEFANGKPIQNHGPDSRAPSYVTENRARRRLGRDYDLSGSNCIDFVHAANRKSPSPWQIGRATGQALSDMVFGKRRR